MNPNVRVIDGVRFGRDDYGRWERSAELDHYDLTVTVEDLPDRRASYCSVHITHRRRNEMFTSHCTGLSRVRAVRNAWFHLHPWLHKELWVKQCGGKP